MEARELLAADLAGTYFNSDEPLRWGQAFTADAVVANQGDAAAGGFTVAFYLSANSAIDAGDYYLGSRNLGPINAGASLRFDNHPLQLPSTVPAGFTDTDSVFIGMILDAGGQVGESNELNNRNLGTGIDRDAVRVDPAVPQPDLAGAYFNSDEPLRWGQAFHVDATVANLGNAAAGSFTVNFYLSTNSTINAADYLLGTGDVDGLAVGASVTFDNRSFTLPSALPKGFTPLDDVYIGMIVDAGGQVAESNEINNQSTANGRDRDAVHIDGDRILGNIAVDLPGDSRHAPDIDVFLQRVSADGQTAAIARSVQTWVVVHGRLDNSASFHSLASAIDGYKPGDQVVVLDWAEGAADNHADLLDPIGLDGAAWIPYVAGWTVPVLRSIGIVSTQLYVVGHSWGSFVAYEIARQFPGTGERLVALDPAADAVEYADDLVNFRAVTAWSWAFYGGGLSGSAARAGTADEAFLLEYTGFPDPFYQSHGAPRHVFQSLVERNNAGAVPRSSFFQLSHLESPSPRPWRLNAYDVAFEGTFTVDESLDDLSEWGDLWEEITRFRYTDKATGLETIV